MYRCIIIIAFVFIIVLKRNLLLHQFVPRKPCNHHTDCRNLVAQFIAQKMKFPIKDLSSECEHIRRFLRIWSYLLKKSLTKNFIFCAVVNTTLLHTEVKDLEKICHLTLRNPGYIVNLPYK